MNVDLTKPELLPDEFLYELQSIDSLCRSIEFSEKLVEHNSVTSLVFRLNEFCMKRKIIGVHYTRAVAEHIENQGLLIRNGADIRQAFLDDHGYLFLADEIQFLKQRWANYFTSSQSEIRDNRVFFNFTESSLYDGGAEYLLGLYGGEQVGMGFEVDDPIGNKLANIGKPLIVRCALNPLEVETFIDSPWGKILVSSYHKKVNPDAYIIDQDGYQSVPVAPENIVEIRALTKP